MFASFLPKPFLTQIKLHSIFIQTRRNCSAVTGTRSDIARKIGQRISSADSLSKSCLHVWLGADKISGKILSSIFCHFYDRTKFRCGCRKQAIHCLCWGNDQMEVGMICDTNQQKKDREILFFIYLSVCCFVF